MNRRLSSAALTGAALIALVLTGCDSAELTGVTADGRGNDNRNNGGVTTAVESGDPTGSVDLVAGQNTVVGSVSWETNDDGTVDVTYQTLAGYCITEWHLDGGTGNGFGIPLNNGGNPKIGNFQYGEELPEGECESTIMQTLQPEDFEGEGDRILAAHAVVEDDEGNCSFFYGIASDGHIYEIRLGDLDPNTDTIVETSILDTGLSQADGTSILTTWPNSLAFNAADGILYFSDALALNDPTGPGIPDPNAPLYHYNFDGTFDTTHPAGDNFSGYLSRRSASGTFIDGEFYYVPQNLRDPNDEGFEGDNLRKVTFDGNGEIVSRDLVCAGFTGNEGNTPLFFGDIAYDSVNGLIYGSVRFQPGAEEGVPISTFFSINPETCEYIPINTETFLSQLTIDCDGNLIGYNTRDKLYYLIDRTTGEQENIGSSPNLLVINDLAPGQCDCPPDFDETAWGRGMPFQERGSWAMYINIGPAPEQED